MLAVLLFRGPAASSPSGIPKATGAAHPARRVKTVAAGPATTVGSHHGVDHDDGHVIGIEHRRGGRRGERHARRGPPRGWPAEPRLDRRGLRRECAARPARWARGAPPRRTVRAGCATRLEASNASPRTPAATACWRWPRAATTAAWPGGAAAAPPASVRCRRPVTPPGGARSIRLRTHRGRPCSPWAHPGRNPVPPGSTATKPTTASVMPARCTCPGPWDRREVPPGPRARDTG